MEELHILPVSAVLTVMVFVMTVIGNRKIWSTLFTALGL